jgi:predicted RNA polymerase sigma factor
VKNEASKAFLANGLGTAESSGPTRVNAAQNAAETVARRSYGKLVAFLASRTRDVAAAEDALSEAFASALVDWPRNGCPDNPEAWLLTAARRKAIDVARRQHRHQDATEQWKIMAEGLEDASVETGIPDQRLALMFACAHPAIEQGVRSPLILQVVLGLDAKRIASAFLVSPTTMGKRLVRAKEKIREAGIPFRIPEREELGERLEAVLDAIYAAFAEGWSDPGGTDAVRRDLTEEAMFLAQLVVEIMPEEPEALGLLALLLHAEARRNARRTKDGAFVPLAEQDTDLWDLRMIFQAEDFIRRASTHGSIGRYRLESALQSAHVFRRRTGIANWKETVQLYNALLGLTGSPVVAINRALAMAEDKGAPAGLAILEELAIDSRIAEYQPYWAARAELLRRTQDLSGARQAYEMAIGLERDPAVRRFLQMRQESLEH